MFCGNVRHSFADGAGGVGRCRNDVGPLVLQLFVYSCSTVYPSVIEELSANSRLYAEDLSAEGWWKKGSGGVWRQRRVGAGHNK